MTSVALREFRHDLTDIAGRVQHRDERVVITRNGRPAFAVVPVSDLEALEALEDQIDLADAANARRRGGKSIPISKVRRILGLD